MKSKKVLTVFLGLVVILTVALSGIIIVKDIHKDKTNPWKTNTYPDPYVLEKTNLESFSDIIITASYTDISIVPSDGYYLEYRLDGTYQKPDYGVSDGKFHFTEGSTKPNYNFHFDLFGFSRESMEHFYLTLYVPQEEYFNLLSIYNDSGNVNVDLEQIQTKKAEFTLDYGNLTLKNFTGESFSATLDSGNLEFGSISCDSFTTNDAYGNIIGDNLSVSNLVSARLDSGNFEVMQISAGEFSYFNEYGDTDISSFTVGTGAFTIDSGNLSLSDVDCQAMDITSEYGNVDLNLQNTIKDYNYDLYTEYGSLTMNHKTIDADEDEISRYKKDNGTSKQITASCDSGNITITAK